MKNKTEEMLIYVQLLNEVISKHKFNTPDEETAARNALNRLARSVPELDNIPAHTFRSQPSQVLITKYL
jgi:hypothetical protein